MPSLKCTGTKETKFRDNTDMYVGTLTADEIVFAGADANGTETDNIYLMSEFSKDNLPWWTLSPYNFEYVGGCAQGYIFYNGGLTSGDLPGAELFSRPVVTLKAESIRIDGNGTISQPYIIN